jgi:hypothetical protein
VVAVASRRPSSCAAAALASQRLVVRHHGLHEQPGGGAALAQLLQQQRICLGRQRVKRVFWGVGGGGLSSTRVGRWACRPVGVPAGSCAEG